MTLTAATPVRLDDLLDVDHLGRLVEQRLVSCRAHPTHHLRIYDYTARASYSRSWDHETKLCRGLIVDREGYVVGRPFAKFFTLGEHEADASLGVLPLERDIEAYDKLDGSLGILYRGAGQPAIATRGSFESPQARWATEHYRRTYGSVPVPDGVTYLFEIIYPDNRFIVDYGDFADLVLLAVIDTATGADRPLPDDWPGPRIKRRGDTGDVSGVVEWVRHGAPANAEGMVIRFAPAAPDQASVRVKVKCDEYVRLHRLLTGVTARTIWEHLAAGRSVDDLVDGAPEPFVAWVNAIASQLRAAYTRVETSCRNALSDGRVTPLDRRGAAGYVASLGEHAPVVFKMLDGRPYDQLVWRAVRPAGDTRFRPDLDR